MKSNILKRGQLLRDIVAAEPAEIKSVEISRKAWELYRPTIKKLQRYGLWYDVSECYNKLLVRVRVNEITENYLQAVLDEITC